MKKQSITLAHILNIYLIFIFITLSQGSCISGWFGDRCQYACHCVGSCDSSGECTGFPQCKIGWFGPLCQYVDLTTATDATVATEPPLALYSNWLTDGDDHICNTDPALMNVTVTWKQSYPFTWLRLVAIDPSLVLSMQINFKNSSLATSPEIPCYNQRVLATSNGTVDVYCNMTVAVQQLTLNHVRSLCSLYISGGRNVALKQQASQSSTLFYQGNYIIASNAVDGSLETFSHTNTGDNTPSWMVHFEVPVIARTFILYNRHDSDIAINRLRHFTLVTEDDSGNIVFKYTDATNQPQAIYRLIDLKLQQVTKVNITANFKTQYDANPYLHLCEVEIYGECPAGTWGMTCNNSCPHECPYFCHLDDGTCNTVCVGQSDPPYCNLGCLDTKWGLNCGSVCSSHCSDQQCNRFNGECTNGCFGYTNQPYCTEECMPGLWGVNCSRDCSSHCHQMKCDGQTSECFQGCQEGYELPNCTAICNEGFYGRNCTFKCPTNCDHGNCNHVNGVCYSCLPGFLGNFCDQECLPGYWGENCTQRCSDHCSEKKCNGATSECIYGCQFGYTPPHCIQSCPEGWYGVTCSQKCSPHCEFGTCDPITGVCSSCLPGYVGVYCEKECDSKFYGKDCLNRCSDNCVDQLCDPHNGSCFTCFIGKFGANCDDCPLGTYGENCKFNCSSYCKAGTGCDPIYGTCYDGN